MLQKLIDTDDGARRLWVSGLVPHSPIAASGMLFFTTLPDENAASHIALGQAYSSCLRDGDKLTPEQLAAKGANESLIHVDWMIGSGQLDIDGITATGVAELPHALPRRVGLVRSSTRPPTSPCPPCPIHSAFVTEWVGKHKCKLTFPSRSQSFRGKQRSPRPPMIFLPFSAPAPVFIQRGTATIPSFLILRECEFLFHLGEPFLIFAAQRRVQIFVRLHDREQGLGHLRFSKNWLLMLHF